MHKIIIDTDPGIDDAQAIALAIAHPDIELLGLTTVFGNADIDTTTRNALTVLEQFNQAQIPVAKGAAAPLQIERYPAPDFVHGADGLGNVNLALPSLDPQLPDKVKRLVVMGGTVSAPGNVSPVAEANFIGDPHAADIVCGQDWPLTIIGLDVTMQTAITDSLLQKLRSEAGQIGEFLWHSSRFYVDFYSNLSQPLANEPACAMHDASAVINVVCPELFETVSGIARVVVSGIAQGQLILDQG